MIRFVMVNLLLFVGMLSASACSSDENDQAKTRDERLRIVASTAVIGEFVSIVAGSEADVEILIPSGVDLHSFEPLPSTAASVAEADLIFVNGRNLEEGILDIIEENVKEMARVIPVSAGLDQLDYRGHAHGHDKHDDDDDDDHDKHGHDKHDDDETEYSAFIRAEGDPHFWLDVTNAIHYVEVIRDELTASDPKNGSGYRDRAATYIGELEALHQEMRDGIANLPEDGRDLVVFHDAYQYFAAAYGLELTVSMLPHDPQQAPSSAVVAELIELIEEHHIAAIYAEPQFDTSVIESIANETDTVVLEISTTFTDEIVSYVDLMRFNLASLIEGAALKAAHSHSHDHH